MFFRHSKNKPDIDIEVLTALIEASCAAVKKADSSFRYDWTGWDDAAPFNGMITDGYGMIIGWDGEVVGHDACMADPRTKSAIAASKKLKSNGWGRG